MDSEILPDVELHRSGSANTGTAITLKFAHAKNLFKRQHNKGKNFFQLKKDSPYKLSKNGDLILNPSKRNSNAAKSEQGSPKSKEA